MNIKNTVPTIILSSIFFSMSAASAKACITVNDMLHIFSNQEPEQIGEADFVGKIEITKVGSKDYRTMATAVVQASETHPDLTGEKIQLTYLETSCGPYVNKGDKGYISGKTWNLEVDTNMLIVQPRTIKFDWTQLQNREETPFRNEFINEL